MKDREHFTDRIDMWGRTDGTEIIEHIAATRTSVDTLGSEHGQNSSKSQARAETSARLNSAARRGGGCLGTAPNGNEGVKPGRLVRPKARLQSSSASELQRAAALYKCWPHNEPELKLRVPWLRAKGESSGT
jgi:hypothetical protein